MRFDRQTQARDDGLRRLDLRRGARPWRTAVLTLRDESLALAPRQDPPPRAPLPGLALARRALPS